MGGASRSPNSEAKLADAGHPIAARVSMSRPTPPGSMSRPRRSGGGRRAQREGRGIRRGAGCPTAADQPCGAEHPAAADGSVRTGKSAAAAAAASVLLTQGGRHRRALGADVPRAGRPNGSPSPPGRSSPRRRAASSTSCPPSTMRTAAKIAERLSERAEGTITVEDVRAAKTVGAARHHGAGVPSSRRARGFVRTRALPQKGPRPGVRCSCFHPAAGGSTVVYEPLLKRLPADVPVYGLERVEGLHRGARRRVRAQADGTGRGRARTSWPAGRWAAPWPTPAPWD